MEAGWSGGDSGLRRRTQVRVGSTRHPMGEMAGPRLDMGCSLASTEWLTKSQAPVHLISISDATTLPSNQAVQDAPPYQGSGIVPGAGETLWACVSQAGAEPRLQLLPGGLGTSAFAEPGHTRPHCGMTGTTTEQVISHLSHCWPHKYSIVFIFRLRVSAFLLRAFFFFFFLETVSPAAQDGFKLTTWPSRP